MNKLNLNADKRNITGRKVKRLREGGILPGNVYGKKVKSLAVQVKLGDFKRVYKEVGVTGLIELQVAEEKRPVLVHNLQVDPVTDYPVHIDFLQVDLKEKVTAEVPVELVGVSLAEKQGLGTVVQYLDKVEVEALPEDLPARFEIDLTKLSEIDQAVHIKDLPVDTKKVEIKADADEILVKVEPPRKEEVEEIKPAEEATVEVPAAEGEEKAEGEKVKPEEEKKEAA